MDADVALAFANITATLNLIQVEIASLKGTAPPAPVPTPHPSAPPFLTIDQIPNDGHGDPDYSQLTDLVGGIRIFKADFWVKGFPGAQKGVDLNLWGGARTGMSMMAGFYTGAEHLYVVKLLEPQPDRGAWINALKSVADIGWVDGSGFVVDPNEHGGAAQARWTAAGRPTADAEGYLIVGGTYSYNQAGVKIKVGDQSEFKVA